LLCRLSVFKFSLSVFFIEEDLWVRNNDKGISSAEAGSANVQDTLQPQTE